MDAIEKLMINVVGTVNVLHPILCMKKTSLIKVTIHAEDILVLLKHHSRKDSGIILDTSKIK